MDNDLIKPAGSALDSDSELVDRAWRQIAELDAKPGSSAADPITGMRTHPLPADSFAGYRILREIHRGGQGVVYEAIQESTDRTVAIKVLKQGPFADGAELARFEREVHVLSRLNHPNIVTIHDRGSSDGHAYLVMDYVSGRSLNQYLAGAERTPKDVLSLFVKICDAVHAAHLRGIIHRDLKPGNIRIDDDGEPHVLDFGLAKLAGGDGDDSSAQSLTITGQFVGSLPWTSPEQATGKTHEIDLRTDVYSLGVIVYQMLTGAFPYLVTGSVRDVQDRILHAEPIRPGTVARHIDGDLDTIVLKCLAKQPERRYQSAGDLARDILRYLAHEPIEARPATAAYQLRQFVRRHRALAVSVCSVFVILVAATAGTTWALIQSTESSKRATAINSFMSEVLTSVDPATGAADVRLIDVLARASASASQRFAGNPLQEAEVRALLGKVYNNLSMWPEARVEYARALAFLEERAGLDDPRTLETALDLLGVEISIPRISEAEKSVLELMPRLERVFGPGDLRTLGAHRVLAITHMFRGREDEAERILLQLRANPHLADANADDLQIGIIHSLNSIALRRCMDASPLERARILRQIEPLAHERVERATRRHGPESPDVFFAQARLANVICRLGRHQAAADICRGILDRTADRLGQCHNIRMQAMTTLAEALTGLGELREPAELRMQQLTCLRQRVAAGDPVLLSDLSDSFRYVERAGEAATGEMLTRELMEALAKFGGGHGDMSFNAEIYLAHFISMQDRLDEAEPMFQSLVLRAADVQVSAVQARFHLFHGYHLMRRRLFDQAEQAMRTAVQIMGDVRTGTWMTHPDDIVVGFIALYEALGNQEKLEEYRRLRDEAWALAAGLNVPEVTPAGTRPTTSE